MADETPFVPLWQDMIEQLTRERDEACAGDSERAQERDEARAQATAWREKFARLETERASCCVEMEQENTRLRALLHEVEWAGYERWSGFCPICSQLQQEGHAPDCGLAAALREGA